MIFAFSSSPFDGLVAVLPKGGKLPKSLYSFFKEIGHEACLFLGGESPKSESNRSVGEVLLDPQSPQNVARLQAGRGASRPWGNGHVFHGHYEGLSLDEFYWEIEDSRVA